MLQLLARELEAVMLENADFIGISSRYRGL
jgi:hypothetical protein